MRLCDCLTSKNEPTNECAKYILAQTKSILQIRDELDKKEQELRKALEQTIQARNNMNAVLNKYAEDFEYWENSHKSESEETNAVVE